MSNEIETEAVKKNKLMNRRNFFPCLIETCTELTGASSGKCKEHSKEVCTRCKRGFMAQARYSGTGLCAECRARRRGLKREW